MKTSGQGEKIRMCRLDAKTPGDLCRADFGPALMLIELLGTICLCPFFFRRGVARPHPSITSAADCAPSTTPVTNRWRCTHPAPGVVRHADSFSSLAPNTRMRNPVTGTSATSGRASQVVEP